ncbi:MAG: hypothetical protein WC333_08360 [Dehalococcoidia bacterium]
MKKIAMVFVMLVLLLSSCVSKLDEVKYTPHQYSVTLDYGETIEVCAVKISSYIGENNKIEYIIFYDENHQLIAMFDSVYMMTSIPVDSCYK